ncbi:helicase [Aphelenchoides avenae]|nr:helicase [Aphelenchus avenae]
MNDSVSSHESRVLELRQVNLPEEYQGRVVLASGLRVVGYGWDKIPDERAVMFDAFEEAELEALREAARNDNQPCVVCLEEDASIQKLSACGHILCDACLCNMVTSQGKYPIVCPQDACPHEIALSDLDVAFRCHLGATRELLRVSERLLITAFMDYLRSAQNSVALCKNEGCNGVIELEARLFSFIPFIHHNVRSDVEEDAPRVSRCSSCEREHCVRCGNAPHEEPNCAEAYVMRSFAEDEAFREWHTEDPNNRRVCPVPKCMVSAEKEVGCNHTQCATCKTHYCWKCTAFTATTESAVYAHLRQVQRGIGAVVVQDEEQQQRRQMAELHMQQARVTQDIDEAWEHFRQARDLDQATFAPEEYALQPVDEEETFA